MTKAIEQRICSDQVIVDLPSALKELVENALDAGATKLDVRLREHGVELLEVADNGQGIPPSALESVALRHTTSKLRDFSDLQRLRSFGFRGEALNSLAALSSLGLASRTAADVTGSALTFNSDGGVETRQPVARDVGTCVSVTSLFEPFPVRRRELRRGAANEFRRLVSSLQAYSLICHGVRFHCTHTLAKGGKSTVLQTPGGAGGMRAAIAAIFGARLLQQLTPISGGDGGDGGDGGGGSASDAAVSGGDGGSSGTGSTVRLEGFISRPRAGDGRRTGDRQYVFVNGRPVDFPRLCRLLCGAWGTRSHGL